MHQKPIFLHSSWRTGSTYVWAKFRPLPETYCYFEPLNEHLATATQAFVDTFMPWSYAHHPTLDAPYLEEFRAFLEPAGGFPGFPADLSYGHYRSDRSADLPELTAYFDRLSDFARSLGKTAVFGCVRSNLRLDWFKHHLSGVHIFLLRDPRCQFISFLSQAVKGNRYFLERGWVILGRNRDDPAFAPIRTIIDVPVYDGPPELYDAFYGRQAWNTPWSDLYTIFYFQHLLALKNLRSDTVDLLIDIDRLSCDAAAVADTESKVLALTGAAISFADCRVETYDEYLMRSPSAFADLEAKVAALM